MRIIFLIVQGTRQKQSIMKKPKNGQGKAVLAEAYSIVKGLIITILGGLAVLYLAGLFLL